MNLIDGMDQQTLLNHFKPKCIHGGRDIALSARGYLVPCCWLDRPDGSENFYQDTKVQKFYQKELHLDNNKSVDSIIKSETWQTFFNDLIERPETSSPICLKMCTVEGNPNRKQYYEKGSTSAQK